MIPAIGYMIAAYIITRMVELLCPRESVLPKLLAVPTILITLLCAAALVSVELRSMLPALTIADTDMTSRPVDPPASAYESSTSGELVGLTREQVKARLGAPSLDFGDSWIVGNRTVFFDVDGRVSRVIAPK